MYTCTHTDIYTCIFNYLAYFFSNLYVFHINTYIHVSENNIGKALNIPRFNLCFVNNSMHNHWLINKNIFDSHSLLLYTIYSLLFGNMNTSLFFHLQNQQQKF